MATHSNRRLRKKLHLGEFAEYGFEVGFGNLDQDQVSQLTSRLSMDVFQLNGIAFLDIGDGRIFVSSQESSLTNNARRLVDDWAKQQGSLPSFEVGPLVDAWHPPRGVRCFSSGRKTVIFMIAPGGRSKECRTGIGRDRFPT